MNAEEPAGVVIAIAPEFVGGDRPDAEAVGIKDGEIQPVVG